MSLGDHLRELRRRLVISRTRAPGRRGPRLVPLRPGLRPLTQPLLDIARQRGDEKTIALNFAGLTAAFSQRVEHRHLRRRHRLEPGLAVPAVGVHRARADPQGAARQRSRSSPRSSRCSSPAAGSPTWTLPKAVADPARLHAAGRGELPRRRRCTSASSRGSSWSSAWPSCCRSSSWRSTSPTSCPRAAMLAGLAAGAAHHLRLRGDRYAHARRRSPCSCWRSRWPSLYFAAVGVATLIDRRRAKDKPDWSDVADDQASAL